MSFVIKIQSSKQDQKKMFGTHHDQALTAHYRGTPTPIFRYSYIVFIILLKIVKSVLSLSFPYIPLFKIPKFFYLPFFGSKISKIFFSAEHKLHTQKQEQKQHTKNKNNTNTNKNNSHDFQTPSEIEANQVQHTLKAGNTAGVLAMIRLLSSVCLQLLLLFASLLLLLLLHRQHCCCCCCYLHHCCHY